MDQNNTGRKGKKPLAEVEWADRELSREVQGEGACPGNRGTISRGPEEQTRAVISISNGEARGDQTHFPVMIRSLSLSTEPHKRSGKLEPHAAQMEKLKSAQGDWGGGQTPTKQTNLKSQPATNKQLCHLPPLCSICMECSAKCHHPPPPAAPQNPWTPIPNPMGASAREKN